VHNETRRSVRPRAFAVVGHRNALVGDSSRTGRLEAMRGPLEDSELGVAASCSRPLLRDDRERSEVVQIVSFHLCTGYISLSGL